MKNQIKLLLSAAAFIGFSAHAQWGLVANGGFETGDFTGWNVGGNTGYLSVQPNTYSYGAHTGNFYVFYGAVGSDTDLNQAIVDNPGQPYLYSFWLAGDGSGYSDGIGEWNGVPVIGVAGTVPNQGYTEYSTIVIGTGLDQIDVLLRNDPSFDALDDVSLIPLGVPDSGSTMAMMSFGLLGLGGVARRFRR